MASVRVRRPVACAAHPDRQLTVRDDGGFTLVEVVVALVLMSITMSAVAVMFVGGIKNSSGLQRRQAAVLVAQQALEVARAVSATPDSVGCSKLMQGRTAAVVDPYWASAPASVTSSTTVAYSAAGCSGPVVVPVQGVPGVAGGVSDPVRLNGLPYTVNTYIGTCRLVGTTSGCTPSGTGARLYRVVVAVRWTASGCGAGCIYTAGTLLDPSVDPVYNVRGASAPVAAADAACFRVSTPAVLNVLANDTGALGRSPVTVVAAPTRGTLGPTVSSGVVTYTPGAVAGTDTFTYRLVDVNGVISGTATVTLTLTSGACP